MLKSGVYAIVCVPTGQSYVGTATSLDHRSRSHLRKLIKGVHNNGLMQESFNKYGIENFDFVILEECTIAELLQRERFWVEELDSINTGFNAPQLGSNGFLTHGLSNSRVYKSWDSMIQRCTNENSPDYPRYGGKGITVCERWRSFENFYADMGDRPVGTTIDRYPIKLGNYEPGNCRWATGSQQQKNKENSINITHEGITKSVVDWADEKGMPRDLLRMRYYAGMVGNELFAPSYSRYKGDVAGKKRKRIETRHDLHRFPHEGKMLTINELVDITGIPRRTLSQRLLKYQMPLEKALQTSPLKKGKVGPRKGHQMMTAFGKTQSLTAWAKEYKIPLSTLRNRIFRAKMLPEDSLTKK